MGRTLDFSVIKSLLCQWLEDTWDHRFLVWEQDPMRDALIDLDPEGVVATTFNPTAENMADHLLRFVAPAVMDGTGVEVYKVTLWETENCCAEVEL